MNRLHLFLILAACASAALAQSTQSDDYRLALPNHKGKVHWSIKGFKIIENSAKANGSEIGLRGRDASGRLTFLGFLFLAPESVPMTSATCREAAMNQDEKTNSTLKLLRTSDSPRSTGSPVALVAYTTANRDRSLEYIVRGFVATADICGDLEFYSDKPITENDADLKEAFLSFQLDPTFVPQFSDLVMYAQILFLHHDYRAAAPIFENALSMVPSDGAPFRSATYARRVMRDQAGMSYGISGDLKKSRRMFEEGTAEDPDYPMYYYNLACADAGEKKLADARVHLRQAFDRKSSVNPGETMPVPTEDDSFLPYKNNKDFWAFLLQLQARK